MNNLDLGNVAFYWRMTEAPGVPPNIVPDYVSFEFSFSESEQLIIQKANSETWEHLELIYRENSNVGYLQEDHALAESYGSDFIACIKDAVSKYHPVANSIGEVGAGGCYLLKRLQMDGYTVTAIDPSPIAIAKGAEYEIEVIPGFYPSDKLSSTFDVMIHYDVLEHVPEPVEFIRHHRDDLNPDGICVLAVPDCTAYIESGDISMLLHEHLNYFDADSLRNVVEAAGLSVREIRASNYGGVLYCIAQRDDRRVPAPTRSGTMKFDNFVRKYTTTSEKIKQFIDESHQNGNSLGCYIPLRGIPYLSTMGIRDKVRFFDDDPGIHHKYFDGFPIAVENMQDLKNYPPTHLLIMSYAFGEKIRDRVKNEVSADIRIFCPGDLDHLNAT